MSWADKHDPMKYLVDHQAARAYINDRTRNDKAFVAQMHSTHIGGHRFAIISVLPSDTISRIANVFAEETGVVNIVIISPDKCRDTILILHAGRVLWEKANTDDNPNLINRLPLAEVQRISQFCTLGVFEQMVIENGPSVRYVVAED